MNKQHYYEFNNHEYYGLVVADDEEKAYEVYVEGVGGSSVDQIKSEGKPDEITLSDALGKTLISDFKHNDRDALKLSIQEYYAEFVTYENTAILVDGSLV